MTVDGIGNVPGNIILGTGFRINHTPNTGIYTVLFTPPVSEFNRAGVQQLQVIDPLMNNCNCNNVGANTSEVTDQGVELVGTDRTGFVYRTFVIDAGIKCYRDHWVSFSVLVTP